MSTSIIFNKYVTKLPFLDRYNEDVFIAAIEIGSNNLIDDDGKVVTEWIPLGIGTSYEIMRKIVQMAYDVEGGVLAYKNRETLPENFIKGWRSFIKDAVPFNESKLMFNTSVDVSTSSFKMFSRKGESGLRQLDNIATTLSEGNIIPEVVRSSNEGKCPTKEQFHYLWKFNITDQADYSLFKQYAHTLDDQPLRGCSVYGLSIH